LYNTHEVRGATFTASLNPRRCSDGLKAFRHNLEGACGRGARPRW
jgi:hypothetical protein